MAMEAKYFMDAANVYHQCSLNKESSYTLHSSLNSVNVFIHRLLHRSANYCSQAGKLPQQISSQRQGSCSVTQQYQTHFGP